jgi:hypothetical protein
VQGKKDFYPAGGYTPGQVDVEINGQTLGSADLTATDGSVISLAIGCGVGDLVRIVAYGTATLANAVPADGSVTTAKIVGGSVTQAKLGAGVAGNGPAFSVYATVNQSFTTNTFTKVTFPSEEFDTNACYDTSLSRFTPTVAGYYEVAVSLSMSTSVTLLNAMIFKNGNALKGASNVSSSAIGLTTQANAMVYLNGSTDYVEAYIYATGTSPILSAGVVYSFFQGFLARSAT